MRSRNQNRSSKISVLSDGRGIIKYYGEDIFIAKNHLNGAFDKDEVHYVKISMEIEFEDTKFHVLKTIPIDDFKDQFSYNN